MKVKNSGDSVRRRRSEELAEIIGEKNGNQISLRLELGSLDRAGRPRDLGQLFYGLSIGRRV